MNTLNDGTSNLHPVAGAVIRYFTDDGQKVVDADEVTFLTEVFVLVDRLSPQEVITALDDLIVACRFLHLEGYHEAADDIAGRIIGAAHRASVRKAGAGTLSSRTEQAGERFSAYAAKKPVATVSSPRPASPPPPAPPSKPLLRQTLATRWSTMSEQKKTKLAKLADNFLEANTRDRSRH